MLLLKQNIGWKGFGSTHKRVLTDEAKIMHEYSLWFLLSTKEVWLQRYTVKNKIDKNNLILGENDLVSILKSIKSTQKTNTS